MGYGARRYFRNNCGLGAAGARCSSRITSRYPRTSKYPPSPSSAARRCAPEKGNNLGVYGFLQRERCVLSYPHPHPPTPNPSVTRDRRPQGGSRAPRRPAEDGAVDPYPSALPRGRVAGTGVGRGEARRWAPAPDHPPPRRGGRTAALPDKGRAVGATNTSPPTPPGPLSRHPPRLPPRPKGSRSRPGALLTASPRGKGPSQPPGDTDRTDGQGALHGKCPATTLPHPTVGNRFETQHRAQDVRA